MVLACFLWVRWFFERLEYYKLVFLESLVDGSFKKLEEAARVVPFNVGGENFNALFALVDGIYPRYSRFVKGIPMPLTAQEIAFSQWQESS